MILNKLEAVRFLESSDGQILQRVRVERDWLANHIDVWASSSRAREWVADMVAQSFPSSAFSGLINHFAGDHRWHCCDQVEGLALLCQRAGELERKAVGKT